MKSILPITSIISPILLVSSMSLASQTPDAAQGRVTVQMPRAALQTPRAALQTPRAAETRAAVDREGRPSVGALRYPVPQFTHQWEREGSGGRPAFEREEGFGKLDYTVPKGAVFGGEVAPHAAQTTTMVIRTLRPGETVPRPLHKVIDRVARTYRTDIRVPGGSRPLAIRVDAFAGDHVVHLDGWHIPADGARVRNGKATFAIGGQNYTFDLVHERFVDPYGGRTGAHPAVEEEAVEKVEVPAALDDHQIRNVMQKLDEMPSVQAKQEVHEDRIRRRDSGAEARVAYMLMKKAEGDFRAAIESVTSTADLKRVARQYFTESRVVSVPFRTGPEAGKPIFGNYLHVSEVRYYDRFGKAAEDYDFYNEAMQRARKLEYRKSGGVLPDVRDPVSLPGG
jgi:hypothetical protein